MDVKTCIGCEVSKPLSDFGDEKRASDGKRSRCRECIRKKNQSYRRANVKPCIDCGETSRLSHSTLRCRKCSVAYHRGEHHPNYKRGYSINASGYVRLSGYRGHPNANAVGAISEHVLVMSETLGRPLVPGETVHHKNGVRDDNRPENLELWSTSQPPGQRVEDKLQWALELVELYAQERLKR